MKTISIGIFALLSVLIFTFTIFFVYSGSTSVSTERRKMKGDMSTAVLLAKVNSRKKTQSNEIPSKGIDMGIGDLKERGGIDGGGPKTVLWISIPGFRGDYVEQAEATFLEKMTDDGASTTKLRCNFPTLTYPGHTTLATGTTPKIHGIPSDRFKVNDAIVSNPMDPSLLKAEPIWETATRQGIATLVHDWPLSQNQTGANKAATFLTSFDAESNDQQRLDRLWNAWASHKGEKKLRLLMCRLDDILKAGLTNGPRADETYDAVKKTDEILKNFFEKVKAAWPNLRSADNGNLVVVITTDHGLAELEKNVNIEQLMGEEMMKKMDIAAHDAVGHVYFKNLPDTVSEANLEKDKIDSELKKKIYFRTYRPDELPSDWKYNATNGRVGDRVLVLKAGFAFTDHKAEDPVFDPSEGPGLYGGFGYPVTDSIRMSGQAIIYGYPEQVGYTDMDEIDQTIFHSTVCKLLEIKPSEKASDRTLDFF